MLIGILQCGHFVRPDDGPFRDYFDLYADMLAGRGLTFKGWDVVDMEFPSSVHDAEGWLISGSRHGAYEDLPFIPPLEDFIRKAFAEHVPMVGICFGHQIMAKAFGGKVEKFPGGWSMGHHVYDFEDGPLALNAFHQDQVTAPPPNARSVARSPFCEYAAFAYDGPAYSVQAHPEFGKPELTMLLEARSKTIDAPAQFEHAWSHVDVPVDNAALADRIATFFKENRHV